MNEWFPTFQKIQQTPLRDLVRLQVSGRLNWRARIVESDLPEAAKNKITDIVKATRLWRLEKSQIADELIAHFADGQERGTDVAVLVEKFGDTATVAPLMRAAKKRNRSILWKTLVASGYAFVAFLVFYVGLAVWFMSGKPSPSVDYFAVVSADARAVPAEQRAWPIYREAWIEHNFHDLNIQRLVGAQDDESWNDFRPGDPKWPNVVAFLESKESLVEAIRRGGQLSGFGLELKRTQDYSRQDLLAIFGPDNEYADSSIDSDDPLLNDALIGALLGHVQQMRQLARILETDVFRMAAAGDAETVAEDLCAMFGLGPQAAETPFLVSGLVGLAMDGIAYNTIEELLSKYPDLLDEQQLETIANTLASLSPRTLIRYEGEIAFQKDLIQRIYSDDGAGDGRLTDEGLALWPSLISLTSASSPSTKDTVAKTMTQVVGPGVAFISGSRKDLEEAIDGVMKDMTAEAERPFHERSVREIDFYQMVDKHAPSDLVARTFMQMILPAVEQVARAGYRTEGYRNGALLGVAAYRFRLQNERFPATVDELVPEFLKVIPIDVLTGKPLQYRLQERKPLIYSVGADLDDDGGVEAVDPLGRTLQDMNLGGDQHFDTTENVYRLDGDWILWPSIQK